MKEPKKSSRRQATTADQRERQMVDLAIDLAEQQLREGTASSSVITHYLKLGTTRERLEQERLRNENTLLQTKVDVLESNQRTESLYREALEAMKSYGMTNENEE